LESIVVSGIGAISSVGNSVDEIWNNIMLKKSGIEQITRFDTAHFKTKIAAEIKIFNPIDYLNKKDIHKMDRISWYALAAVKEAIHHSKIDVTKISSHRIGLFWSSGNGGIESTEEGVVFVNSQRKYPVFQQIKILNDSPVGWIAQYFKITGITMSITAACSSSIVALQTAQVYIHAGLCDFAIVGGSEAPITPTVIAGFSSMGALSKQNYSPQDSAKAFSILRDGFVVGEGAAALVIGLEKDTQKQNMPRLAKLSACNSLNDAQHFVHPNESGIKRNIIECLKNAHLNAVDINAVFPHATSTILGDASEYQALKYVFQAHLKEKYIFTIKNNIGHLLGASGAISAVMAVKCIEKQHVLPNKIVKNEIEYEELNLSYESQKEALNHILCFSSGFGGHHAACIFSKIIT